MEQNPEIPIIPGKSEIPDLTEFEGVRVKIEGWEIIEIDSYWDPENTEKKLVTPVKVKKLKVFTQPVTQGKKGDGTVFPIRASALFSMKRDDKGNWGLSDNPKSNFQKFLHKIKVNTLKDLVEKYVTITLDENGYLRIVTG